LIIDYRLLIIDYLVEIASRCQSLQGGNCEVLPEAAEANQKLKVKSQN